jgi:hypothetical protein
MIDIPNKQEQAERLLRDEFFLAVVKLQQDGYISLILNSSEDDVEVRERSLVKYRAIEEFVASIESMSKQKLIDKKRWKIL